MNKSDSEHAFFSEHPKGTRGEGGSVGITCRSVDIELLSDSELADMSQDALLAHAINVQNSLKTIEEENKFLNWEFKEYQDNLAHFSRAAKLAHKLSGASLEIIAEVAVNDVPEYFGCEYAAFFLYDPASKTLSVNRSTNALPEKGGSFHVDNDSDHLLVRLLLSQPQPFLAEYMGPDSILVADNGEQMTGVIPSEWHELLGKKAIILPFNVPGADNRKTLTLGGLVIGHSRRDLEVGDAEVAIFFADLLSSSLYNAKLVQQLNDLTIIEPLTQIYNRRYLINQLSSAMVRARRHRHKLSIAMLDIDHFKRFNDTYGHLCGDEVLRELATVLKESVRAEVDIPARYGGEEFMLVMPFTDLAAAQEVSERVRRRIKSHTFSFERYRMSVTCSIGVAEYIYDESLEEFIDRADACLYQAKRGGRDQVCATPHGREST